MGKKPSYEELQRRVEELEQITAFIDPRVKDEKAKGNSFHRFHKSPDTPLSSKARHGDWLKQTQNTLVRGKNLFQTAFQSSPDSVVIIRIEDQLIIDVNAGFAALIGSTGEQVIGKPFKKIKLWQPAIDFGRLVDDIEENGSVMNEDSKFRDKNGLIRDGQLSAMFIALDGKPHILMVLRDIDRLKKMEEALEVSEARFRELFNSMSSGVIVCRMTDDGNFVIVDINRAAEIIEGVNKGNLQGKKVLEIFPKGEGLVPIEVLHQVRETGESTHYPTTVFKDDKPISWKENYIFRLPSGEIIVVCDDVTKRKKGEEKLLAYQKQLLSLASELSLAEERERRNIATELHDQIGQTLSVIKIKLHNLRETLSDAGGIEQLDEIQKYLTETIRNTRSLTFELSPPILYELGLEPAIEWLCERFHKQHGIQCSLKSDGLPKPLGEDVCIVLFRSLRELLTNVFKHAKAEEVLVSIHGEGDQVRIMVEDNGIGFDPSSQVFNNLKNQAFGLFSIRERLRHLGGQFRLKTRQGQGTCVTLEVPLRFNNP